MEISTLTVSEISLTSRRVVRPLNFPEKVLQRFPEGTMERIDSVKGDEDRATFVREAVERELKRRERRKPEQGATGGLRGGSVGPGQPEGVA